jgi:hypothetical protein
MRRALVIDTETTSLTPDYETGAGVIWELAVIDRADGTRHLWRMEPDLAKADPGALQVGRFYERTLKMSWHSSDTGGERPEAVYDLHAADWAYWSQPRALAAVLAPLLDRATLIAANPTFDAGFLAAFLRRYGQAPTWHYRLRDIGSMAWGYLQAKHLPHHIPLVAMDASTDDFARALRVEPDDYERHTAMGDCQLADAMLDVIEWGGTR